MKFNNFSQRSADNNLISLIIDIFVLILSFGLAEILLFRNLELLVTDTNLLIFIVIYGVLVIFFFTVFEMYSSIIIGYKPSMVTIILTSLYSLAITEFVSLVFLHDGRHLLFVFIGAVLSALLLLFWRYCRHLYFLKRKNKTKILMVEKLKEDNSRVRRLKYSCLDMYDAWYEQIDVNDIGAVKKFMKEEFPKYDGICMMESIPMNVKDMFIKEALKLGKEFFIIPAMYELNFTKVLLAFFDDVMVLHIIPHRLSSTQMFIKRFFDLLFSGIGILVAAIPMLLIALVIRISDGGPAMYTQVRLTKGMREFNIYKFRTMVINAEKMTGPMFAQKDDPRITKLGKFLRKTRLDELPQLFNVFLGDMSFVGPRPERPFFVEQFRKEINYYDQRFCVKAGLTSLSHVCGRYSTDIGDRTLYDLLYIINFSLMLDLKIILLTTRTIFLKEAAEGVDFQSQQIVQQKKENT